MRHDKDQREYQNERGETSFFYTAIESFAQHAAIFPYI